MVAETSAVFAEGLPLLPVVAFRNLKASLRVAEPREVGDQTFLPAADPPEEEDF